MYDLSWLNPPPHATAVYASCSALLPPHATLASRRPATALPGPDLHRLIAPALAGAFLLDHFVCNADYVGGEREPDCFGSLEINDHLEFARLDDRQIGGGLAFENPSRHNCQL